VCLAGGRFNCQSLDGKVKCLLIITRFLVKVSHTINTKNVKPKNEILAPIEEKEFHLLKKSG
jgi:hypothetical protein